MTNTVTPAMAFPPGDYLRDELEERGWTEKEFAEILGRPAQTISEILNGRKQIVPDTALAIGEALNTSAEVWIGLQTAYNLQEAKAARTSRNRCSSTSNAQRARPSSGAATTWLAARHKRSR